MYVYDGTKMRGWPYRRTLLPSIGYRFREPLVPVEPAMPVEFEEFLGTEPLTQNTAPSTLPVNLVRVALAVAAGAVVWTLYKQYRESPMNENLPGWPGIGPLFNVGSTIGSEYALGPFFL